ncbi:MAG: PD-(D/E)XK nuclease family protein [Lewinellaceae bacterium]|nr:PD-(D/E)XK nuclease family protein [Lewinellaceae bacterium]
MASVFSKLYSYRQRENKNNRENYLTEVFAYCLEHDLVFFRAFMNLIELKEVPDKYTVATQVKYGEGNPDIEIKWNGAHILIECKIDSGEGWEQLNRYTQILNRSEAETTRLVYLTKYPELKPATNPVMVRWYHVKELISKNNHPFTRELKQYLNDQNMKKVEIFKPQDEQILTNFSETFAKVEAVLNPIADYFLGATGIATKNRTDHMFNYMLGQQALYYHKWFTDKETRCSYELRYGFRWEEIEPVHLFLVFRISLDAAEEPQRSLFQQLKEQLEGSDNWEEDNILYTGWSKPIGEFPQDGSQLKEMTEQLQRWIKQVIRLMDERPETFNG